jgi:DUF971 family protein
MKPNNIQVIQNEVAIVWDDGTESYIPQERLRRRCPCAACAGEKDVLGNEYRGPAVQYTPQSFQISQFQTIGGYAIGFVWGDGHHTGIYSYDYLKKLGEIEA